MNINPINEQLIISSERWDKPISFASFGYPLNSHTGQLDGSAWAVITRFI